jgi:hypothetical protein
MTTRTAWFREVQWGVMTHFLAVPASVNEGSDLTVAEWNAQVNRFDVKTLADQLEAIGAGYFILTLGQTSGYYCSPNATYDEIVGIHPSKCSERDLMADLYEALAPKGIKLIAYIPSEAPFHDPIAMERLDFSEGVRDGKRVGGQRLASFQTKWEAILREWSIRWGKNVAGWWIDGCYSPDDMYRFPEAPNFASFAAALRAGNPESIIAFNPGVKTPIISITEHEDYTAGEIANNLPVGIWNKQDFGYKLYDPEVNGAALHVLTFLGSFWGKGEPRFPDDLVRAYTQYINKMGGVITWDVPITGNGHLPESFIKPLSLLRRRD